ncbi:MAG: hypothetical protein GHCLOJNM_04577 [bacterium]|nr:hypothetical protein [bacterium]
MRGFRRASWLMLPVPALFLALASGAEELPQTLFSRLLGARADLVESATFDLSIASETRKVSIDSFYIKTKLVTVEEYSRYLDEATKEAEPEYWRVISKTPDKPVVGLDLRQIVPFLKWLNAREGATIYRLASEAEWRRAQALGALTDLSEGYGEFLLDRYSESFEEWDVPEGTLRNPFGPILGLNVVGMRLKPDGSLIRGAIAPDHVSLRVGFRYAFSPKGPGPLGARMMKEGLLARGLPAGNPAPGAAASAPRAPVLPRVDSGAFSDLFAELAKLRSQILVESEAHRANHRTYQLMEAAQRHPLVLAGKAAPENLRKAGLDAAGYEKLAASIQPIIQPMAPAFVARVYGEVIRETFQTMQPRDSEDQRFFQTVGPMAQAAQGMAAKPPQFPFQEGTSQHAVAMYLVGFELEKFAKLWRDTVGRYPPEIREKDLRAEAIAEQLSQKFPNEFEAALAGMRPQTPGKP